MYYILYDNLISIKKNQFHSGFIAGMAYSWHRANK